MLVTPEQLITAHQAVRLHCLPIQESIADVGGLVPRTLLHRQVLSPDHLHLERIQVVAIHLPKQRLVSSKTQTEIVDIEHLHAPALERELND